MITEFESWASEGASKGKLNKNVSLCTETGLFNLRDRYVCVCVHGLPADWVLFSRCVWNTVCPVITHSADWEPHHSRTSEPADSVTPS